MRAKVPETGGWTRFGIRIASASRGGHPERRARTSSGRSRSGQYRCGHQPVAAEPVCDELRPAPTDGARYLLERDDQANDQADEASARYRVAIYTRDAAFTGIASSAMTASSRSTDRCAR